ncbi:plasmid replication initiator RepA (plasmid) [Buchnera aphidicola (Ceratoglyphina bambusae)]|uniref:plasmid replication initiator RepA n=1 Tax=Buchnera aphidicola TaxID=9 RepID=UPI0031B8B0CC
MYHREKYIFNRSPKFTRPKKDKSRPAFIKYAIKMASSIDVARTELNYIIQPKDPKTGILIKRKRRLNEHRACAMRAIVIAMIYHFNITSDLVQASVEQLADECGLSTISKAGNKSITRVSRLITDFMEPMGFVICEKVWDKVIGNYTPKMIILTPLFFKLIGISSQKLYNAKKQQLGWINKGLVKKGLKKINFLEARRRGKDNRIRGIFKHRHIKHIFYRKHIKAKKILALDEKEAKQKILRALVSRYSIMELTNLGPEGLKKQINIEYYYLRKLATSPIPNFY